MKKILVTFLAVLVLAAMLAIPAMAADGSVTVSSATGASGETVTLTVSLSSFEQAKSVGVSIVSDLTLVGGSWTLTGGLVDRVLPANNAAAWAASEPATVNGDALNLQFQLPAYTGVKAYPVTVKVEVKNGDTVLGAVTASGTVTVNNPAESVTLDKSTLALDLSVTKTAALTATVLPANCTDGLVWSSSDASVASVANGAVTALKPGTATITATAGTKSATCAVTVSCSHKNAVAVTAKGPTCQATGNNAYYTCADCNQVLKSDKATVTTVAAETLATIAHSGGTATCTAQAVCSMCQQPYGEKKAHSFATAWSSDANQHWHICTTCNTEKGSVAAHSFTWKVDKAATEDETGLKHEECACGYKQSENTVIEKLPHSHVGITRHPAVAATCKATGNVEYWTCSSPKCAGKYYGNVACGTELTQIVTAINPQNHTGGTRVENAATANCYKAGYTGDTWCKGCNVKTVTGSVIPATGKHTAGTAWYTNTDQHWHICTTVGCGAQVGKAPHSFKWAVDKAATEDATGLKHEECTCGVKRSENTVIPKLDHVHGSITHHAAVPATCVKTGTVEYWTCGKTKCAGKYYSDAQCQLEISIITQAIDPDNHAGKTELRDQVEATCAKDGYSGDAWCLDCKTMSKKGAVVPATGKHTPKTDYLTDENNHWQECSVCNAVIDGRKEGHTFTWKVDKYATEYATGLKHEVCSVCKLERSKDTVIDKLPHVPAKVEGKAATCTEDGVIEHFHCANCGGYYVSTDGKQGAAIKKEDTVIAALGHSFAEEWTADEKSHWHVCAACGETSEAETHTTELVGAVEATETAEGYTGDTVCTVCETVVEQGQTIPIGWEEPTVSDTMPTQDTDDTAGQQAQEEENGNGWILWLLLILAAAAVAVFLILKKRKK